MSSSAIMLMIMAQQRANAARRAIFRIDPQLPNQARHAIRTRLRTQYERAKADADRYADLALREMERGRRTGDLLALVNMPEEE